MKLFRTFAIVISVVALGCDKDPARSVKFVDRSVAAAAPAAGSTGDAAASVGTAAPGTKSAVVAATAVRTAKPGPQWHPDACPPPPEDSPGPSSLSVTGPCAFQQRGAVVCESLGDDFIVAVSRKAANGATLVAYINVEAYKGPGSYDEAQMFVAVQDGKSMYRWSNERGRVTVGPGEAFLVLPTTRLEAEPMLVDCGRVIGPETNYQYDCGGRTDVKTPLETTFEVVSGRLSCQAADKEK
jgi:hypothetical protein